MSVSFIGKLLKISKISFPMEQTRDFSLNLASFKIKNKLGSYTVSIIALLRQASLLVVLLMQLSLPSFSSSSSSSPPLPSLSSIHRALIKNLKISIRKDTILLSSSLHSTVNIPMTLNPYIFLPFSLQVSVLLIPVLFVNRNFIMFR